MKTKIIIILTAISLVFTACTVEPKAINYGDDHCHLCDMTVVDKTHAAEYVTQKGKAFMFDAIECMVMKINKGQSEDELAFILIADYANPGNLVDAKTATYLISEKIKSPMGANLTGFASKDAAEKVLAENGGKLYSWEELKKQLKK